MKKAKAKKDVIALATPLDRRIASLQQARDDFFEWRYDDTSAEQYILVREAIKNLDLAIAHMIAFRALL